MKAANRFFSKVGTAVRQAGKAAKQAGQQVTGVGRGSVQLTVERNRYAPGDDIRGKVTLDLAEPIDAKRLIVVLTAVQRTVDYQRTSGIRTAGTTAALLYEQTQELGGARRYAREEITFSVPLPKDTGERKPPAPDGRIGAVARAVSSVVAPASGPIEWRLTASLVISWGRDLEHSVDIVVDA